MSARSKRIAVSLLVLAVGTLVAARAVRSGMAATVANIGPAGVVVHSILPTRTDPLVTGPGNPNLALADPRVRRNGLLMVFLPGTGGKPGCCTLFLRTAASLGYLAIGLTYNNSTAVGARCLNDLSCFGRVRRNVFDGAEPSPYSNLSSRDGIEHRLASLLRYLAIHYPHEGWGRFLAHGLPRWNLIVLSGHSQGGGEAAFIGTIRALRGVVTLSSPPDTNLSHQPATWVTTVDRGLTPLTRIVGFVHSGDPFYPRIISDWQAMGLPSLGQLVSVDDTEVPYRHTHQLISYAPLPRVILATHDSTAVDSATPACPDGSPEYAPVWRYMMQVAGGLRVVRGRADC